MRALALLLAFFVSMSLVYAEEDPNYLYSLTFKRGMTMTRYAKSEYADGLRSTRPEGVSINWVLEASDDVAESLSQQEIDAINLAISEALKTRSEAVLVLSSIVIKRQGIWAFYTADGASLASTLEASLKGKTRTPAHIRVGKDPDWKAYTNFLAKLREEK
jgi:Family of unknown function (DUF695)